MTRGKLSGREFHQWHAAAARGDVQATRFVRRRFQRTWAHEEEAFYVPEIGRMLAVLRVQGAGTFAEPSFHLSPRNLLPTYRKRQTTPGTFYLDRAVFLRHRGEFVLHQIPAAKTLWRGIEARGASSRPIGLGLRGYAVDLVMSAADVETLCLTCEQRELVFLPSPVRHVTEPAKPLAALIPVVANPNATTAELSFPMRAHSLSPAVSPLHSSAK